MRQRTLLSAMILAAGAGLAATSAVDAAQFDPDFDPGANAVGAYAPLHDCKRAGGCWSQQQRQEAGRAEYLRRADARHFLSWQNPPGKVPDAKATPKELPVTSMSARYEGKRFLSKISEEFEPRLTGWLKQMDRSRLDVTCVVATGAPSTLRFVLSGDSGSSLTAEVVQACTKAIDTTVLGLNLSGNRNPVLSRLALVYSKSSVRLDDFQNLFEAVRSVPKSGWKTEIQAAAANDAGAVAPMFPCSIVAAAPQR